MEAGNPCSTTTCSDSPAASARASASCPRPAATRTTTSSASTRRFAGPLRGVARVAVQARRQRRRARAPALAGPHLRRRRQRDQPARRVARARPRRRDARGVGGGRGALRGVAPARSAGSRRASRASTARPEHYRGLGLLGCSNTVHYDAEHAREDAYRAALREGMRPGYAAGDGAALHFAGEPPAARRLVAPRGARVQDAERARARDQEPAARVLPRGRGAGGRARAAEARRPAAAARARGRALGVAEPPDEGGRARRILAMGGGGFSTSVADAPLEHYIAGLPAVDHPASACSPRRAETPTTRSTASTGRSAGSDGSRTSRSSGSARTPCSPREHLLGPGRDLRGRREPRQPARDLARARARRHAARGVGARNRALRRQRGLHVLVRGGGHPLARALAPGPGPRAAARAATRCTTRATRSGEPATAAAVLDGLAPGYAVDDGVGLLFAGTELVGGGQRPARRARLPGRGARRRAWSRRRSCRACSRPWPGAGHDAPVEIAEFRDARRERQARARRSRPA